MPLLRPRINVVAAISGSILHPKGAGHADGTNEHCPVESALLDGETYLLENFLWDKGVVTKHNMPPAFRGAWTTAPKVGPGQIALQAKSLLPTGRYFVDCSFQYWERNLLTPTPDDALIDTNETIEFDRNIHAGLIAHYKYENHDLDIREPMLEPGRVPPCDPTLFLSIGERRVAYELQRLAEGSIQPIRNDSRSAAHGSLLPEPRISRDLRARIVRAARAAADSKLELRELLLQVPPTRE